MSSTTAGARTTAVFRQAAEWALAGIVREFPAQIPLCWPAPQTVTRPRDLTPVFYGCYDWHSAVHSHWALVRVRRLLNDPALHARIETQLEAHFQPKLVRQEFEFFALPERSGFERPYGLAWLLQLTAELRLGDDAACQRWLAALEPLEALVVQRFRDWLPRLERPVRTGEHAQTAFALGLVSDWSLLTGDALLANEVATAALRHHSDDHDLPWWIEPSAYDFLSPALGAADLMRRVCSPGQFAAWMDQAFPRGIELVPVSAVDDPDGKRAHFAGLNFSRAWMLWGIAAGLPYNDSRRTAMSALAEAHWEAALPVMKFSQYSVTHWVGSFATYAATVFDENAAKAQAGNGYTV